MAVVQVSNAPSRELYDQVTEEVGRDDAPAGLIVHAAAELPTGEIQIVDVFESREALEAFARDRLFPAFEKVGVMDMVRSRPQPQPYDAIHLLRG